ncbi:MAG: acetyl-CoA C-acyltransferase [Cryomorphaceae bacterium]|jgi:acetyl-CoA acyltransferase|nr:MAG: acetyl-CoA C-acyltransferase [Cryomorphaceae bacterium]|tara:strand:- start:878 stop:2059 length:1182 start_codon:yes stop_codon:yes gene_type:complete
MKEAYIIKAYRTAVGKAPRGFFKFKRPDELAAETIEYLISQIPDFDKKLIDDLIVGNAMPEAEQGFNVARLISLMGLKVDDVPGVTINRFCASGLETIAIATAKIKSGMSDCIIAGGVESMSYIPMTGFKPVPNYNTVSKGKEDYYWGMGLTAEQVAKEYKISRESQDVFAYESHQKAIKALEDEKFKSQIAPISVKEIYLDENLKRNEREMVFDKDQGPRKDTSVEALSNLRPVFSATGSVTAGNSSQMSDGAAFVMIVSEKMLKVLNVEPIAKLVGYSVAGLPPKIMGMGPVRAVPKVLDQVGMKINDIELIELNEAFASQSIAVINELKLEKNIVNVNGGAIALGHPLGCSGAKLSVQLFEEMKNRKLKYGMVTMCVGTGQGAAGIFEKL